GNGPRRGSLRRLGQQEAVVKSRRELASALPASIIRLFGETLVHAPREICSLAAVRRTAVLRTAAKLTGHQQRGPQGLYETNGSTKDLAEGPRLYVPFFQGVPGVRLCALARANFSAGTLVRVPPGLSGDGRSRTLWGLFGQPGSGLPCFPRCGRGGTGMGGLRPPARDPSSRVLE